MRLIDVDMMNEDLFYEQVGGKDSLIKAECAFNMIMAQPTAYDIDNVVEELKERTDFLKYCTKYGNKNAKQQAESYSTMMMYEVADLVDDLIEIVKQGGVSDDVCEWKSVKLNNEWKPSCDPKSTYNVFGVAWFKRCPYCGKKIKVVD